MFSALLQRVEERCAVLENFLRLCDVVDEVTAQPESVLSNELESRGIAQPSATEDRVFRHCAVMSQVYALYESFAESMLSSWLVRLPRYHTLQDLPEGFRNAYRSGIARILQNIDHRRYRHLSLTNVLDTYLIALQGGSPWEFINDALILHDANLRHSEFVTMFNSVDLTGVWPALEQNNHIRRFKEETDSDESLESLVLDLVTFRNEASHGTPDEILGSDALRQWVAFVRAFCSALADVITHRLVLAETTNHPECVLGIVTEAFQNNVIVAVCDRGSLAVGETIYFLRDTDCVNAVIESLQLNGVDQTEIRIAHSIEVGIRTSTRVRKKARLVRLEEPSIDQTDVDLSPTPVTSSFKQRVLNSANRLKRWLFS